MQVNIKIVHVCTHGINNWTIIHILLKYLKFFKCTYYIYQAINSSQAYYMCYIMQDITYMDTENKGV